MATEKTSPKPENLILKSPNSTSSFKELKSPPIIDLGSPLNPTDISNAPQNNIDIDIFATLPHTTRQYTQYLRVNSSDETKLLDGQLDTILGRLDEVKNQYEITKGIRESHEIKLTSVKENLHKLETLFTQIDKLDAFMISMEQNLSEMETKVIKADKELNSNPIRKVFSSNPVNYFRKKPAEKEIPGPAWEPPTITLPGDYFNNTDNLTEAINTHIL